MTWKGVFYTPAPASLLLCCWGFSSFSSTKPFHHDFSVLASTEYELTREQSTSVSFKLWVLGIASQQWESDEDINFNPHTRIDQKMWYMLKCWKYIIIKDTLTLTLLKIPPPPPARITFIPLPLSLSVAVLGDFFHEYPYDFSWVSLKTQKKTSRTASDNGKNKRISELNRRGNTLKKINSNVTSTILKNLNGHSDFDFDPTTYNKNYYF